VEDPRREHNRPQHEQVGKANARAYHTSLYSQPLPGTQRLRWGILRPNSKGKGMCDGLFTPIRYSTTTPKAAQRMRHVVGLHAMASTTRALSQGYRVDNAVAVRERALSLMRCLRAGKYSAKGTRDRTWYKGAPGPCSHVFSHTHSVP
jgi:hypothetical protein